MFKRKNSQIVLLVVLMMMSCSKTTLKNRDLFKDDAVWMVYSEDIVNPKSMKSLMLRFDENGFAYEVNSILKYPYKIHRESGIFELNGQQYQILEANKNRIVLQNAASGIQLKLNRQ